MVVAGREAGITEFWTFTLGQGVSPRCWKRIEGRIAAHRPVVVCVNDGLNELRKR
jgi:hypothetical protein